MVVLLPEDTSIHATCQEPTSTVREEEGSMRVCVCVCVCEDPHLNEDREERGT